MRKILPIEIQNAAVVTECWTFEKLAIIQTSPYARDWLASHFRIYIDNSLCVYFGEAPFLHRPMYYEDILDSRVINYHLLPADRLMSVIREHIDEGWYISMTSNWNLEEGAPAFHELLIYGYDDEKEVVHSTVMQNRRFVPVEIPYSHLRKSLPQTRQYFKQNPGLETALSINYQWPMTAYTLKDTYSTDMCVFMAMDKIDKEKYGTQSTISISNQMRPIFDAPVYYTGLGCLSALEQILTWELERKPFSEDYKGLTATLKKMHEHRRLLLLSMRYIQDKWGISDALVQDSIQTYEECCKQFETWYLLGMKYEQTADPSAVARILGGLYKEGCREKETLFQFHQACLDYRSARCAAL